MKQLTKQEMLHINGGVSLEPLPPEIDIVFSLDIIDAIGPMDHGGGFHDQPDNPLDDTDTEFCGILGPMDHGGT